MCRARARAHADLPIFSFLLPTAKKSLMHKTSYHRHSKLSSRSSSPGYRIRIFPPVSSTPTFVSILPLKVRTTQMPGIKFFRSFCNTCRFTIKNIALTERQEYRTMSSFRSILAIFQVRFPRRWRLSVKLPYISDNRESLLYILFVNLFSRCPLLSVAAHRCASHSRLVIMCLSEFPIPRANGSFPEPGEFSFSFVQISTFAVQSCQTRRGSIPAISRPLDFNTAIMTAIMAKL